MSHQFRAIITKELREIWWIGLLGSLAVLWIVGYLMGWYVDGPPSFLYRQEPQALPFLKDDFIGALMIFGGVTAAVLGLRQTLGESAQGTWMFFLFRPADRHRLILTKIAVGIAWLMFCTGLPLFVLALWAATPGTHISPFEWWMTGPAVRAWGWFPVVYCAAFLCGLRPARWWVSRFLPGIISMVPAMMMLAGPWWSWQVWLANLVLLALLLCATYFAVRQRDYA
ncbi:MAG: hypothetical protein R3C01_03810 [Planctomycetaceae bacterium]